MRFRANESSEFYKDLISKKSCEQLSTIEDLIEPNQCFFTTMVVM